MKIITVPVESLHSECHCRTQEHNDTFSETENANRLADTSFCKVSVLNCPLNIFGSNLVSKSHGCHVLVNKWRTCWWCILLGRSETDISRLSVRWCQLSLVSEYLPSFLWRDKVRQKTADRIRHRLSMMKMSGMLRNKGDGGICRWRMKGMRSDASGQRDGVETLWATCYEQSEQVNYNYEWFLMVNF